MPPKDKGIGPETPVQPIPPYEPAAEPGEGPPFKTPVLLSYDPVKQMNGVPTEGVGLVSPFAGRIDPWPGNRILQPNDVARAAIIARYGVPSGCPPADYQPGDVLPDGTVITEARPAPNTRIGYCAELFPWNGIMLMSMALEGEFGPGVKGEPTLTEMMDLSFMVPRRSDAARKHYWEASVQGGMEETSIVVDVPDRPHGTYTEMSLHGWPLFYWNVREEVPPEPVPEPKPPFPLASDDVLETAVVAPSWLPEKREKQRLRMRDLGNYAIEANKKQGVGLDRPSAEILDTARVCPTWLPPDQKKRRMRYADLGNYAIAVDAWLALPE